MMFSKYYFEKSLQYVKKSLNFMNFLHFFDQNILIVQWSNNSNTEEKRERDSLDHHHHF